MATLIDIVNELIKTRPDKLVLYKITNTGFHRKTREPGDRPVKTVKIVSLKQKRTRALGNFYRLTFNRRFQSSNRDSIH